MLLANENTKHKPHETEDLSGEDWKKKWDKSHYIILSLKLL